MYFEFNNILNFLKHFSEACLKRLKKQKSLENQCPNTDSNLQNSQVLELGSDDETMLLDLPPDTDKLTRNLSKSETHKVSNEQ